ncbi:MAG: extracellular solute-binding protein [Clostridia bacterium]|nr:extracellular solute-binding protein [Clostridia bacterium]
MTRVKSKNSAISKIYAILIYVILYFPIAVMILFSFNDSKSMTNFTGFSLRWYRELFNSGKAFEALKYSLLIAVLSALISTVIGTLAAYGIFHMRSKALKRTVQSVTDIPMMNPDIVTGISMLLLFAFIQVIFGLQKSLLGFGTLLIAHITFNVPYVILSVLPKLKQMDKSLVEAALDLGCTPAQSFFKVEFPMITPGIISGAIMAFTLSLDDFVISNFTIGNTFETLPIMIYSMTKREVTPDMNAICSIVFVVIFALLLLSNIFDGSRSAAASITEKLRKNSKVTAIVAGCVAAVLLVGSTLLFIFAPPPAELTLNIYNWGEYISDGSDDSFDVIEGFEEWYEETYGKKVKVNYTTYSSNEDMYNKISSGATEYDIIIPSDYMIAKMASEGMLEKLDFSLIPNYKYINDDLKGLYYDPDECYSVPYTYGVFGIIYNSAKVDEADVEAGWDLMTNPKYSGKILQYNNPRDAFGVAMYAQNLDVNSKDRAVWQQAFDWLAKQKPMVQSYVMDEIYNKMESGEAYISSYYAGDFLFMYENNEDLAFYQPEAVNYFIDAMCITKKPTRDAETYELCNLFINYMLSEEAAVANAEMLCYASPNSLVIENEEYIEYMSDIHEDAMDILYPEGLDFKAKYEQYAYLGLDAETNKLMNSLWSQLKVSAEEDEVEITNYISLGILAVIAGTAVFFFIRKKKRAKYY